MSIKKAVAVAGLALALTSAAVVTSCHTESEGRADNSTLPLIPLAADGAEGDGIQHAPAGAMAQTHNNVKYGPESRNVMGISVPDGAGPFPLVVWFYGGGFMGGHPNNGAPGGGTHVSPNTANQRNYVFAGPRYTVLNENGSNPSFPMIIEDVLGAIRFLKANASTYKIDTTRVVAAGFSAGGYLTNMVVALSNANHNFDHSRYGNMNVSSKVLAGVSWAGLTNFKMLEPQSGSAGMHNQLAGGLLGCSNLQQNCDDKVKLSNPLEYVSNKTPPLMMYHGTSDNTVPWQQSEILYNKIKEVAPGNTVVFNKINNGAHSDGPGNANEVYKFFEDAFAASGIDPDPCAANPNAPGCGDTDKCTTAQNATPDCPNYCTLVPNGQGCSQQCNTQTQHCEGSSSLGKYCDRGFQGCTLIEVGSPRCGQGDGTIVNTQDQCGTTSIKEYERVIR